MNSPSSAAPGADSSRRNSSDGARSATSSGTRTAKRSCASESRTVIWMPLRSSETSAPSCETVTPAHIAEWLTLSLADSPASRSALPVLDAEPTTSGTCGLQPLRSLAKYDRVTASWRTSQGCLLSLMEGDPTYTEFSETWPSWGTTVDGELWALTTPALRTEGSGSGSSDEWGTPNSHPRTHTPREVDHGVQLANQVAAQWPTPDAALGDGGKVSRGGGRKDEALLAGMAKWPTATSQNAKHGVLSAAEADRVERGVAGLHAVVHANWATPRSEDSESCGMRHGRGVADTLTAQTRQWSTPRSSDANGAGTHGEGGPDLRTQAVESRAWPTPTQRDHKDGGSEACANVPENGLLGRAVHEGEKVGSLALHPDWVSCLMQWPVWWTDMRPYKEIRHASVQATTGKTMRALRCPDDAEAIWGSVGGRAGFPETPVLLAGVQRDGSPHGDGKAGLAALAAEETADGVVPGMRDQGAAATAPHGREPGERSPGEPEDALRVLPREVALGAREAADAEEGTGLFCVRCGREAQAWHVPSALPAGQDTRRSACPCSCFAPQDWPGLYGLNVAGPGQPQHPWEPPRVASGIKDRAKRLRAIGNGQHPFAAVMAWRVLSDYAAKEGR